MGRDLEAQPPAPKVARYQRMHNPTDAELEELQQAAIDRGDDALAAFDAYIEALANRDEAIDENGEVDVYEATLSVARQELNHQLGRLTQ